MPKETLEPVRQRLSLREQSGRTLDQRLAVRFPWFLDLWSQLIARLPPTSRLRRALLSRAVEIGLDAYNRGDLEVVLLAFHRDVEFEQPPEFGDHGEFGFEQSYRGRESFRKFTADWLSGWDEFRIEPKELIDLGHRFLVLGELATRGKGSGVSVSQSMAVLHTLDDHGKVVREQRYFDHAEALEAVGLSD